MANLESLGYLYHNGKWYTRSGQEVAPPAPTTYTLATMPTAANTPGMTVQLSDFPGVWYSNGSNWKLVGGSVTLANFNTDISVSATTNEETLRSITVPGWLMGPNDSIRVHGISSRSATTSASTIRLVAGLAASVLSMSTTSTGSAVTLPFDASLTNSNSKTAQTGSGPGAVGASGIPVQTATIDTGVDFTVSITGQKANASDTLTLRRVRFEYIQGID